jgi:uncharacterized small protein (DUF1192 family)
MSREKQPHIPQELINEMAKYLGIPVSELHRMLNILEDNIGPYEARLNRKLDSKKTLSLIRREIERKGSMGGRRLG